MKYQSLINKSKSKNQTLDEYDDVLVNNERKKEQNM